MFSTVNRMFHFSYFDPDYPTFGLTVTGSARVYSRIVVGGGGSTSNSSNSSSRN
jgi:hypothetical protein